MEHNDNLDEDLIAWKSDATCYPPRLDKALRNLASYIISSNPGLCYDHIDVVINDMISYVSERKLNPSGFILEDYMAVRN